MDTIQEKEGRKYQKPQTKKHDALNIVQGSYLYNSNNYNSSLYYRTSDTSLYSGGGTSLYSGGGTSLYSGLYYVSLYYYY